MAIVLITHMRVKLINKRAHRVIKITFVYGKSQVIQWDKCVKMYDIWTVFWWMVNWWSINIHATSRNSMWNFSKNKNKKNSMWRSFVTHICLAIWVMKFIWKGKITSSRWDAIDPSKRELYISSFSIDIYIL